MVRQKNRNIGNSLLVVFLVCIGAFLLFSLFYTYYLEQKNNDYYIDLRKHEAQLLFDFLDDQESDSLDLSLLDDESALTVRKREDIVYEIGFPLSKETLELPASKWIHLYVLNGTAVYTRKLNNGSSAYYAFLQPKIVSTSVIMLYVAAFVIIMLIFLFYVYRPINKLERILAGAVRDEKDFELKPLQEKGLYSSVFSDLNLLLENMRSLMLKESTAQLERKQAELDTLQSQINPHFLYNTLETIRGQAMVYGLKDVEVMTRSLSKIFRYSISNPHELVSLRDELENMDSYLLIQQLRFNSKFIVVKDIDEEILDYKVPKLIVQPLVENSIYHGLEMKIGSGQLEIGGYQTSKSIVISINDNGLGIPEQKLRTINSILAQGSQLSDTSSTNTSMGLSNVNARIQILYGSSYGLTLYSTENVGTEVRITLPIQI